MAKNHWQIHHWQGNQHRDGMHESVCLTDVPEKVLKTAQTCRLFNWRWLLWRGFKTN